MRREVELYINTAGYGEAITYQRLDLFEEQSINITNSLQDIKDIAKVFTDFTQQFSIPASKPNSKVFKHYYNFDIDGGYDARVKREALIKINGQDYREGFMSLSSVSMKKQLPYAYKVIFYGKTVNLKRLFGDDELDDLASYPNAYLAQFNQIYSAANAKTGFINGYNLSSGSLVENTGAGATSDGGDLCYPFISGKSHYYWDSGNNAPVLNEDVESRNVRLHASHNGLKTVDLKPAIRLYHIILGIEDKYGLTFTKNGTNDFFSTSNNQFYQLYLWLHREKGDLSSQIAESIFTIDLDDYAFTNTTPTGQPDPRSNSNQDLITSLTDQIAETVEVYYNYTISITPSGTGLYSLEMLDTQTGNLITPTSNATDITGTQSRTFVIRKDSTDFGTQTFTPVFKVKTQGGITSFKVNSLAITKTVREVDLGSGSASEVGYDANYTFNSGGSNTISTGLDVVDNMPKMKVIDFLTSIFKMFNLTAFFDDRRILANGTTNADFGKIKVMTVDAFYSEGVSYSIDKYLYTDKHTVSKANIYSEIDFLYQDPSTFAIINSNEITNDEFGNEKLTNRSADINNPLAFDGGKYDVRLGFEHIMFERMTDQTNASDKTTIQWGWMVNKDEFPVLGKPLVFYCHKHDISSYPIVLDDDHSSLNQYIRPANTLTTTLGSNLQTIHFGEEGDEYFAQANPESLFKNYYFNYIIPIYNEKSRLSKFQAILPIDIVIKMKLNDRFVLSGKSYKINSIKMNINTGKADLELINEV